jgi:hypothetical protein
VSTDPFDEILDESFVSGGPREGSADERIAAARRIARQNDQLRASGEIADGTGKPGNRRRSRLLPWVAIGGVIGVVIVVIAVVVA